ncbi:Leucine-rich repeat protein [Legionella moravica]|uniref:Leucine-rich repeat protein n=1 Tax=Legionella moravica TaxID=39962 RepID=A0A378JY45_9GAMM|nr:ankyrin repeat domain-containing protein [Legionella moravica]KTD31036.1 Leucine-rich repeat protein [Legionella moravica]STX63615.1 Leucine-rich repeat protein [Legionella moravica]
MSVCFLPKSEKNYSSAGHLKVGLLRPGAIFFTMTDNEIFLNLIEQLEKIEGLDFFKPDFEHCYIRIKSDYLGNQLLINNIMSALDKLTSSIDNNETSKEISSKIITTIEHLTGIQYALNNVINDHSVSPPSYAVLAEPATPLALDAAREENAPLQNLAEQFPLHSSSMDNNETSIELSSEPITTIEHLTGFEYALINASNDHSVSQPSYAVPAEPGTPLALDPAREKAVSEASQAAASAIMPMAERSVAASSAASSSSRSDSSEENSPWKMINTIPQSAEKIEADDKVALAFLQEGFEILAKGDAATFMAPFLDKDEDMISVEAKDNEGQSLLHYAVYKGHCETTKLLIRAGASLFEKTASGLQPVHIAVLQGHIDCIKVLAHHGQFAREQPVDIKVGDEALSVKSFHLAVLCGQIKLIDELLKIDPKENLLRRGGEFNVLHLAVYANNPAMLTFLLNHPKVENNKDLYNGYDSNGYAPLHLAIKLGHRDCFDILLQCPYVDKNHLTLNGLHPFQLDSLEDPELSASFAGSITSVSFKKEAPIAKILATGILPSNLLKMKLSDIDLRKKTGAELLALFQALPQCLKALILKNNYLGFKTGAELLDMIKILPQGLQSFVWSNSSLSRKSGTELLAIFQALPRGLQSLDLSRNNIGNKSHEEFLAMIQALPEGLLSLGLMRIALDNKTGAELLEIMRVLPQGLQSLDLRDNDLDQKTDEELIAILKFFRGRALSELKLDDDILSRPEVKRIYDEIFGAEARNAPLHDSAYLGTAPETEAFSALHSETRTGTSSDQGVIRFAASSGTFFRPETPEPLAASPGQVHRCAI